MSGEEGWYTDPFARHQARWMSAGTPTKLVRDGDVESSDEPPDGPFLRTPERIEGDPPSDGSDLLRADDAEGEPEFDPAKALRAVRDVLDQAPLDRGLF